jgi:ABC-type Zn2+ transport system substrate-binding protein/surface adhesin
MSFDRKDFEESVKQRTAQRNASRLPQLYSIAAVAPKMEALTRDERWDHYISHLSGVREKLDQARLSAQAKLGNPQVIKYEDMMEQKIWLLINEAQIQAIDLAIGLPKALLESSEKAKELIKQFEEKNAASEQSKS